jgi:hypothetical protein
MRFLVLAAALSMACDSEDSGGGSTTTPAPTETDYDDLCRGACSSSSWTTPATTETGGTGDTSAATP